MKKSFISSHVALLSAQIISGVNVPVGKHLLSEWISPMALTLTRIVFGTIVFWIISLFLKKEKVASGDLSLIALAGIIGIVATQLTFSWGLTFTTPVNFALIVALNPIVVLLLSVVFLKEVINGRKILGILLGILGAILITVQIRNNDVANNNLAGIVLAVINTLMLASYLIIIRKIVVRYSPVTLLKWMFLFAAIVIIPFTVWDLPTQKIYSNQSNLQVILLLSFTLVFSTVLNNLFQPLALKHLCPTVASIYINLQPIIASIVAIWIGQDFFSWDKLLAALLVISGVILVTRSSMKQAD